ncbi:hypothetical protein OO17_05700 [Rhodopseudomonas palustris]|uniref:Uncharacterized protein n=1 Tax=Rhodopseudomonas palustris TaxID=1076 RepID=A0A0D7F1N9_RHOPL|nr:hypothetical protein OO17_05700 [Rhodopseudomonas palustris]
MTENGNRYAIHALKDRRATLAGEVEKFKQGIPDREKQLSHLDAALWILDPDYRADTVPPKRLRNVKLFGGGELNRLILDDLRRAEGRPMSNQEIARAIVEAKGGGGDCLPALARCARANLTHLLNRRGAVCKAGDRASAKWAFAPSANT